MIHEAEAHRERVETITRGVQADLDLGWIAIKNNFNEEVTDDRVACTTKTDWEYRQAALQWNLPTVARLTDKDIEDIAVHEFIHVLMAPLDEFLPDKPHVSKLGEFVTESIARVITHVRASQ